MEITGFHQTESASPAGLWHFSGVSEDFHMRRVIMWSYSAYAQGQCAMGGRLTAVHLKVNSKHVDLLSYSSVGLMGIFVPVLCVCQTMWDCEWLRFIPSL